MDIFYYARALCHIIALIILIYKLIKTKSSVGLSGKTQILFAIAYSTRNLELFSNFISYYNVVMRVIYITTPYITIFLIYAVFRKNNDKKNDTFMSELLITPAFIIALWINHPSYLRVVWILWTFGISLEAVAIIPQLYLIYKKKEVDKFILGYLVAIGLYRTLYIPDWIYSNNWEDRSVITINVAGFIYMVIVLMAILGLVFSSTIYVTDSSNEKRYLIRNIFFNSGSETSEESSHHLLSQEDEDSMKKVDVIPRKEKEQKQEEKVPSYNKRVDVV